MADIIDILINEFIEREKKMQEIEKLKKRLKKVSKKPIMKTYIPRVEKKRKKRIIHNPKEFSEKYLYL